MHVVSGPVPTAGRFVAALCVALCCAGSAFAAACVRDSAPQRVPLVELYSSEGCNSCPPADRWLSAQAQARRDDIALVALHVDYWDNLGWKDRFGDAAFTARQRALSRGGPSTFVYTPEVFVAGHELRGWRSSDAFEQAVDHARHMKPAADLHVRAARDAQTVDVQARVTTRAGLADPQLFVALIEDGLVSSVRAGENRGETLHHDRVARTWSMPTASEPPIASGAPVDVQRRLAIPPDADRSKLSLLVFVQDGRSGEVAQAVSLPLSACAAP